MLAASSIIQGGDRCVERSKTVTITVRSHWAFVDAAAGEVFKPVLEQAVHRFCNGGPQGHEHYLQTVRHYCVSDDGRLFFSAGLVPRVSQYLEQLGYAVQIDDRTAWGHLRSINQDLLDTAGLSAEDADFLQSLSRAPSGQIHLQRPSDSARFISLMGQLFPSHHLWIVVKNHRDAHNLTQQIEAQYRSLDDQLRRPVTSDTKEVWSHWPRMFVGTIHLFRQAFGDDFQIVVFADVESALAEHAQHLLRDRPDATWYAFVDAGRRLSRYEQFRLEEVFGPVIHTRVNDNGRRHTVNVLMVDIGQRTACANRTIGLERKRNLYWNNADWNQAIASVARNIIANGRLSPYGAVGVKPKGKPSVAILVESTEHGRVLQALLPDWELLSAHSVSSCLPMIVDRAIVTLSYVAEWGLSVDVMVRADGAEDCPWGDALVESIASSGEMLLVDLADHRDRRTAKETQSRITAYEQRGWTVRGVTHQQATCLGHRVIDVSLSANGKPGQEPQTCR